VRPVDDGAECIIIFKSLNLPQGWLWHHQLSPDGAVRDFSPQEVNWNLHYILWSFYISSYTGTGYAQDNLGVKKVSALLKNPQKCPIMCFAHTKNLPHFQNQWYINSSNVNIWQDDKVDVITWLDDKLLLWYNIHCFLLSCERW
jgi:hypothetical protein